MKIVQFIRPMFLVALGLHASILFVPISSDSEAELIEEDVPLAALTEDPSRAINALPTPTQLPVPDLNVASNPSPNTIKAAANAQAKPKPRPAPRRVALPTNAAVASSAQTPPAQVRKNNAVAASGASVPTHSGSNSTETSSAGTSSAGTGTDASQTTNGITTASAETAHQSSISFIADLAEGDEPDTSEETAASESKPTNGISGSSPRIAGISRTEPADVDPSEAASEASGTIPVQNEQTAALLSSVSQNVELPPSLQESVLNLAAALVYQSDKTEDNWAKQMREAWISSISRQANRTGSVERVEPIINAELTMAYPIAAAVIREGRSLEVCLDEEPKAAEIGVTFNAQGKIVNPPEILRSTGYDALDIEAIALLQSAENLPNSRDSKAYIFQISVDYNADECVDLAYLQNTAK